MTNSPKRNEHQPPESGLTPSAPENDNVLEALKYGALAAIVVKIVGEVLLLMDGRFEHAYRAGTASDGWKFKKIHLIALMEYPWLTPLIFGLLVALASYTPKSQVKIPEQKK